MSNVEFKKEERVDVSLEGEGTYDEVVLRGAANTGAIIAHRGNHRSHIRGRGREALWRDRQWMPRYHR